MPLTVLTGYLGSGKTTLLKALLRCPEMSRTAVIVNEFGEVGLDDALIEAAREDTVLLPSGCVCCAVRGDLVRALLKLHEDVMRGAVGELDRVVLETTGLADPAPIAHTLVNERDLFRIYRLDGIIATVDAQHGLVQLDTTFESARQVAVADCIVLTKTDLVSSAESERVAARLKALNPAAALHTAVRGAIAPTEIFGLNAYEMRSADAVTRWLSADRYAREHHHDRHDHDCHNETCDHPAHTHGHLHGISSFCLTFEQPLDASKLELAIELLRAAHGTRLLRVKGLLNVRGHDQPFVVHGVNQVFYPVETLERWPSPDRRSRLVFITRDLDRSKVQTLFEPIA